MNTAALKQDDGSFTPVTVVATKGGWSTLDDGRKVRNSELADWSDDAVDAILTDVEDGDEDEDGESRRGNVFAPGYRQHYTKGTAANGKPFIDTDDHVAEGLRGLEVDGVARVAEQVLGGSAASWLALYTTDRELAGKRPLNAGMVRMNLGNRIRAELKRQAAEAAEFANPEVVAE